MRSGYQSTRHTVNSSHSQLVTRSSRHSQLVTDGEKSKSQLVTPHIKDKVKSSHGQAVTVNSSQSNWKYNLTNCRIRKKYYN